MNIIFDTDDINFIKNNNVLLELDTFYFPTADKTSTAYCVVDNIKITDFVNIDKIQKTHNDLMAAYKAGKFELCQDLVAYLTGSLNGELDSFYNELITRIGSAAQSTSEWSPTIVKQD